MSDKFKDATPTSTLVIKPEVTALEPQLDTKEGLATLTKNELVEFAQEQIGIDLDRRFTKDKMIKLIIEAQ